MDNNSFSFENGLIVQLDWISFTVTASMTVEDVIQFMGFSPALFTDMPKGANGYRQMKRYEDISVLYDGSENMGIHVNVSGNSVSALLASFKETLSDNNCPFGKAYDYWEEDILSLFCKDVLEIGQFTRLDIAIDDLGCNYYSLDELLEKLKCKMVVSRFRSYRNVCESSMTGEKLGHTIYFGSRKSSIMFRVYDKKLEQNKGFSPDDNNYIHSEWVRWEMELHKERANELANVLMQKKTLGFIAFGILTYYFRIIQIDDSNRSRCSNEPKWDAFTNGIEKLRLSAPRRARTLSEKEHWIDYQVGPSLALIVLKNGGDSSCLADIAVKNIHRISAKDLDLLRNESPELYNQYTEEENDYTTDI